MKYIELEITNTNKTPNELVLKFYINEIDISVFYFIVYIWFNCICLKIN
jgi:hypothetical protein